MTATAGLASLTVIDSEPVYEYIEDQAERVRRELRERFDDLGIDTTVLGTGSLFLTHFAPEEPLETVADVEMGTDREALKTFHKRLFNQGYYFLPGHMGAVSYQTTEEELDGFLNAATTVAKNLQSEGIL